MSGFSDQRSAISDQLSAIALRERYLRCYQLMRHTTGMADG
ncbi:hypothetical protein [Moorena sp. SIO3I8]|nr:hypothetical protein [Moorena sp. SIO3I8]